MQIKHDAYKIKLDLFEFNQKKMSVFLIIRAWTQSNDITVS